MTSRMILRLACGVIGLSFTFPVAAQNAPAASPAVTARPSSDVPRAAPGVPPPNVQPRAATTPAAQDDSANSPYHETAEDAQMNRMIRNICRGC